MHFKVARTAGGLRGCVRRHFGVKDSDYGSENCHAFMATFANCLLNCWRKCRPDEKDLYVWARVSLSESWIRSRRFLWIWMWVCQTWTRVDFIALLLLCDPIAPCHPHPHPHSHPLSDPLLILFKGQLADRLCHPQEEERKDGMHVRCPYPVNPHLL